MVGDVMKRTLVAALAAVAAACGHPPPPTATGSGSATAPADAAIDAPLTLDQDLAALAVRALALYEAVAAAFTAAGTDCATATAKLDELATTHGEVVTANAKVMRDHRAKELRAALLPHQERFDAAAKTIMESSTMRTCAPDKAFEQAFDRLMESPP